ncbi:MAG: MFS transporter [Rhodanobacter sp.]|nr:MAG: MFS transporter [Rhodanobacter sp.]
MLRNLRPITSLLVGAALLLLGVGLLTTLIPLRGRALGFSTTMLGALTSAYYAGYFVGTFTLPPLIQRIGHIRAFAFCTASVACLVLLHALSSNPWLWLLLRLLAGISLVGLYAIIESWLNAQTEPARRGTVFAIYMMVNLGSLALAQQLLRIPGQSFVLFIVVALLVCAATLPVVATRQAQPGLQPVPRLQLKRLYALAPTAGAGALLSGLAMGAFWGLLPVYARGQGFGLTQVGTYMSVAILGGAALQWPVGRWSDRHDRRIALAVVCALATALALLQLGMAQWHGAMIALIFLYGGLTFAVYPIVVAHLVDHLSPDELLSASSSVLLIYGVGSAIGPIAAGALMSSLGPGSLFGWFALTQALLAVYAAYRYWHFYRTQSTDANFRMMLRTTPAAFDMLPETEMEPPTEPH